MEDQFYRIAPFYDELMVGVPYVWWVGYFEALLDKFDSAPINVLDIACGTGTLTEMLAANGYKMTGIDLSKPMIEAAKKKASEQKIDIKYFAMGIEDFELEDTYDCALSFFDSLNYVYDPEVLQRGFIQVEKHLETEGLFIFDLNTEYALANHLFDQKHLSKNNPLRYHWKSHYDPLTRICDIDMEYWHLRDDEEDHFTITHKQYAYQNDEIVTMLQIAGLEHLAVFQSYTLKPPRRTTDRVHHIARKLKRA